MRRIQQRNVSIVKQGEGEEEVDVSSFSVALSEDTSSFHPQQEHPDEMQIVNHSYKITNTSIIIN